MTNPLERIPEWTAYAANPQAAQLAAMVSAVSAATEEGIGFVLFEALRDKLEETGNWKFAQHLAQLLLRDGQILAAEYFAVRALDGSNGDVFARVSLALALWERRLPAAVYYQTAILRVQARRIPRRDRRRLVQQNIAELTCKCASFEHDRKLLGRWYRNLRHSEGPTIGALTTIVMGFDLDNVPNDSIHAALALARAHIVAPPQSRLHHRMARLVRQGLVGLLRSRP